MRFWSHLEHPILEQTRVHRVDRNMSIAQIYPRSMGIPPGNMSNIDVICTFAKTIAKIRT
jgi:hypothetical protein